MIEYGYVEWELGVKNRFSYLRKSKIYNFDYVVFIWHLSDCAMLTKQRPIIDFDMSYIQDHMIKILDFIFSEWRETIKTKVRHAIIHISVIVLSQSNHAMSLNPSTFLSLSEIYSLPEYEDMIFFVYEFCFLLK